MKNVIVYGSRFGQFYIEALKRIEAIKIIGMVAKGSERSRECAAYYDIPLYTSIDEVQEEINLACIAVKTGVFGGRGAVIAKQLLNKGINVLLEQPIHYKELGECYKIARSKDVYFGVGNLYLNLPAVQNFIQNVKRLKNQEKLLYVNVDLATQVSYPVISILGEVLSALRPWKEIGNIDGQIPFKTEIIKIGDIPITFRAHNEIDKHDIDGFLHLLFQISVGFPSGRISLCDPHGPVIWNPRIHFPDDNIIPGNLINNPPQSMEEVNCLTLYSGMEKTQIQIFTDEWPCAISRDIEKALNNSTAEQKTIMQKTLNNCQAWQLMMNGLGYPEIVDRSMYSYFPSTNLWKEADSLKANVSLLEGMAVFNDICLKTMYFYLQCNIEERKKGYTKKELIEQMQVKQEFEPIIHRWIDLLCSKNYVRHENQKFYFDVAMQYSKLENLWKDGEHKWLRANMGKKSTYDYFRSNALELQQIMNGKVNPTLLLFPEGQMKIANDLYSETAISIYYNQIIASYIKKICQKHSNCRLLELGGGTASTSKCIISMIQDCNIDEYIFSDISDFFVNHARDLFSDKDFVDYMRLDIDSDFSDVIPRKSIDILLAVGVLNNAKNIQESLRNIRKILKNNGQAIIVEAIGESVQMLISQAFMMKNADDERADKNETFLTLEQWYGLFYKTGFVIKKCLPTVDSELCVYNQKIFILNCKEGKKDENK